MTKQSNTWGLNYKTFAAVIITSLSLLPIGLVPFTNIRLVWKWLSVTNAPAYNNAGACTIKHKGFLMQKMDIFNNRLVFLVIVNHLNYFRQTHKPIAESKHFLSVMFHSTGPNINYCRGSWAYAVYLQL